MRIKICDSIKDGEGTAVEFEVQPLTAGYLRKLLSSAPDNMPVILSGVREEDSYQIVFLTSDTTVARNEHFIDFEDMREVYYSEDPEMKIPENFTRVFVLWYGGLSKKAKPYLQEGDDDADART